uniref:Serine protease K12H4.7 n=1 Tax=Panagrellus redivivus TaxID=6233 RepID=A0A7E4V1F8_PANRE
MKGFLVVALCFGFAYAALLPLAGFYNGKPLRRFMDTIYGANTVNCAADVVQHNFTQIVDHFSDSDNRTWNQRLLVNDVYFNYTTDSPVIFIQIGGEDTASIVWTCWTNLTYISLAVQHGALVLQLEHRFFGYSYPLWTEDGLADMSTEALKLLTSQQALADLANFIMSFNEQHKLVNPRWVVFGGSYPGSLCAWFRAQYPNLSVGGICSSAPLWAKVDFYEYAQVMEYAIEDYSPVCKEGIKKGFAIAEEYIYTDEGRQALNTIFNIDPPLEPNNSTNYELDVHNFMATLFSSFQGIIQYTFDGRNNDTINGYGLTGLCENVLGDLNITANGTVEFNFNGTINSTDHVYLQLIADVVFWSLKVESGDPDRILENNYTDSLSYLTRTTYNVNNDYDRDVSAGRGWMWLSCGMALGWLQTTEGGEGMFGTAVPLNYYLKMCYDIFGNPINTTYITTKVAESVDYFKNPWNYTATNVVLPNGAYDPWSALGSYVTNNASHQISVLIPAAAHCSDMYPSRDGEPKALNATRTLIAREVAYYLTQTPQSSTSQTPLYSTSQAPVAPTAQMSVTPTAATSASPTQTPLIETTTPNSGNTHSLLLVTFAFVISPIVTFLL